MDYILFGKNVKKYRALAGLTQEQLSEKAFCTTSYVGQVENGKSNVSLEIAVNIANALGVTVDLLALDSLESPEMFMTRTLFERISKCSNRTKILAYEMTERLMTIIEDTQAK